MTDLYLKKYGIKCNNYTEVSVSKNDITDINNDKSDIYNNINGDLNSKSNENNSNDKCFTSVGLESGDKIVDFGIDYAFVDLESFA